MPTCRGTTKTGHPCKIYWDLDEHGYCKFHAYEHLLAVAPADAQRCGAMKADGTGPCNISWDLDPDSHLCVYHKPPTTTRATSAVAVAGICEDVSRETDATPKLEHDRATKDRGSPSTSTRSPSSTSASTETTTTPTARPSEPEIARSSAEWTRLPARWSVGHFPSRGVVELRFYSDLSWRCYDDPIVLRVPWWSKWRTLCKWAVAGCRNVLPENAENEGQEVRARCDKTKQIIDTLEILKIQKSGIYMHTGGIDSREQLLLHYLLGLQESDVVKMLGAAVSNLKYVHAAQVWVSSSEVEEYGVKALKQTPELIPSAMLLFERVTGVFSRCPQHSNARIHWELTKRESVTPAVIERGEARVGEPVPVKHAVLAECVVRITEIETENESLLGGSINLDGISLSAWGGKSADAATVRRIRVRSDYIVHFRLMEPPAKRHTNA